MEIKKEQRTLSRKMKKDIPIDCVQPVKKRQKTCNFCKSQEHIITNCPKKESFGTIESAEEIIHNLLNDAAFRI